MAFAYSSAMLSREQKRLLEKTRVTRREPNRLKLAMKLAGVTQEQLEAATGIPQPNISNIANGKSPKLTVERARTLASFFGCAIEDIFPAYQVAA